MDDHVAVTRADDGDVVDARRRVRKEIGNVDAGPAVFLKRSLGAEQLRVWLNLLILRLAKLLRALLAVQLLQERLGIEGLQMARPAGHEEENDRFGLGVRQVRRPWRQRVMRCCANLLVVQKRRQGKPAEAAKRFGEKL